MITTVTLNTSIDKAYFMEKKIENGTVMRVASVRNTAGGKGLNVARIAKLCGEKVRATGFAGGFNGEYLKSLLDKDQISHHFAPMSGETRSCINILDEAYGSTEYLEPGSFVTKEEETYFLKTVFPEAIADSEVVTISGSIPKGIDREIYRQLIQNVRRLDKQVILDTSGDLLRDTLKECPTLVKPNKDEIEMLFHTKITAFSEVQKYAVQIWKTGIPYVVISLGKEGALMVCEKGIYRGRPPVVEAVNTVGCGDSMVGAFAVALKRKMEPEEALAYAAAVSAANALSPNTGDFSTEALPGLLNQVKVEKIA